MNLVALHGFLGDSKDFTALENKLRPESSWIPDLFSKDKVFLSEGFNDWTQKALDHIEAQFHGEPVSLVGYSMGGRLALHLVIKEPELFNRVVLLSTHPGIFHPDERLKRRQWEKEWMTRLETLTRDEFVARWLSQPLFLHDEKREIDASSFDLTTLQRALSDFSNTRHEFSVEDFKSLKKKVTWVFGEKDSKFMALKEEIKILRPNEDEFVVIPEAGHRLLDQRLVARWHKSLF